MSSPNFTYRLKLILAGVIIWEFIFWMLTAVLLFLVGYLDSAATGEQVGFKDPENFWFLLFLFPMLGFYLWNISKANKLAAAAHPGVRKFILQPVSSLNSFLNFFFFRNAIVCLIFAMAQPVFGTKKVSGTLESLELVVALDVSNSMNTKDITPDASRLDIAKRALNELVNNLHGEKIGICVFAGGSFVQLPLTSDYSAAKMFITEIETDMISNQGTNVASALRTSVDMFSPDKTSKGIILVTDGENHEEDPKDVLKEIKEKKIHLSAFGIGTTTGGPVPVNPHRPELGYKTTAAGRTVVSKVNPQFISSIASEAGGSATMSSDPFPDLSQLLTEINQMKRTKVRDLQFDIQENRYQIPLFAAIIFWCLFLIGSKGILNLKKQNG
jgi:Ca-activated chloride channel family protein